MNLAIDIGNTLSKIAIFRGYDLVFASKYEALTADVVKGLVHEYRVQRAILSSVGSTPEGVSSYLSGLAGFIQFNFNTPVPITNSYASPHTLGPDRLAGAIGAHSMFPKRHVLAIDAGTTITYDMVTCEGVYLGGAISPGINIRFRSLKDYTQKLPLITPTSSFDLIGTDTQSCIQSGVLQGVINEVDGYINGLSELYDNLAVVFTGGDTFFFDKKLKNSIFVIPNLVLIGLNRILNHNE